MISLKCITSLTSLIAFKTTRIYLQGLWAAYKQCERIQKFKETGNLDYIYKNELEKACFAHDPGYSDSKGSAKTTFSDKILKDRAYEIAINPKYDGYQRELASTVYKFFEKKTGLGENVNEELVQELCKPVIKKVQKNESLCQV